MKYATHFIIFMLFICVQPVPQALAGGINLSEAGGDHLVHIGEFELGKGNIDAAVHEFSKALMIQPNNEEALRYLKELGYEEGMYESQKQFMPQVSQATNRMDVIRAQMDQVQLERQKTEIQLTKAPVQGCTDYYDNMDERLNAYTQCDGTKKLIKSPWNTGDSFVRHLWDDPSEERHQKYKGSTKGSTTQYQKKHSYQKEPIYHPQMSHISTPEDRVVMAKLKEAQHLSQQHEYEAFLKNHYYNSQKQVANRNDIIEEQHMHLVKLFRELEDSRNQIHRLLYQQDELLNHSTHEIDHMREKGRLE